MALNLLQPTYFLFLLLIAIRARSDKNSMFQQENETDKSSFIHIIGRFISIIYIYIYLFLLKSFFFHRTFRW